MLYLAQRRVRTEQPRHPTEPNRSNPIADGLRLAFNGALGLNTYGPQWAQTGLRTRSVIKHGVAQSFNGTDQALSVALDLSNTTSVTIILALDIKSFPNTFPMLFEFTADAALTAGSFGAYYYSGDSQLYVWSCGTNSGTKDNNIYTGLVTGPQILVAQFDHMAGGGASISLCRNGILLAPASQPSTFVDGVPFANSTLYISARTASSLWANNDIAGLWLLDKRKTLKELLELSLNPWQLEQDEREVYWFSQPSNIAFDVAGNSGDQAATNTYSGSASWNGTNRFLAIDVSMLGAGVTVSSMTYGGANCTFIGAKSTVTSFGRIEQWRIASSDASAPAVGSNTLVVNLSGSIEFTVEWASYTGVHQSSPIESFNSAQATNAGSATDASVSVTSVADNCWIHAAVVANDTSITAGNTSRNNISGTLGSGANEDNGVAKTPAGSVTMSYSGMGVTTTWAIAGYAIRPITASNLATTLSAVFGSFTLSGQTSALKDNRLIPSGFGSFALNGKAANLLKSSKLVANFGSFAFTGEVVSLRNNKLIPLAFGNFTLTGIAAAFNYIKQLTINAGNYALNGQVAILSKAVKLVIANGSFTLNGQASALSRTHSILSVFGSFVLNGQAVGLLETHRLPIGMGAYALNGQTIALYTSKLFSVAYGGYTLTGQAASFLANRRLALTVGTYALNGQAVTLTKVGLSTLAASSGGYVLNGQVAGLLVNRKLGLANGFYAYTGQSVQLTLVPALLATSGLYVLNGQNINFVQDRRLHANQGAYTLAGIDAILHLQAAYNRSVARTLLINPENRTFVVNPENRVHTI